MKKLFVLSLLSIMLISDVWAANYVVRSQPQNNYRNTRQQGGYRVVPRGARLPVNAPANPPVNPYIYNNQNYNDQNNAGYGQYTSNNYRYNDPYYNQNYYNNAYQGNNQNVPEDKMIKKIEAVQAIYNLLGK